MAHVTPPQGILRKDDLVRKEFLDASPHKSFYWSGQEKSVLLEVRGSGHTPVLRLPRVDNGVP